MSTDNIAVAVNVIQTVTNTASNTVTEFITFHEPIITGSQGPQGIQGISGATTLSSVTDVNMTGLVDGAILVYDQASQFWKPKTTLDKQTIECGQY